MNKMQTVGQYEVQMEQLLILRINRPMWALAKKLVDL